MDAENPGIFEIEPLAENTDDKNKRQTDTYFKLKHSSSNNYFKFPLLSLNKTRRVEMQIGQPDISNKPDIYKTIFIPDQELYELKFCIDVGKIITKYAFSFKNKEVLDPEADDLELDILGEAFFQIYRFCRNELEGYILKDYQMHVLVPYRQDVYTIYMRISMLYIFTSIRYIYLFV